MNHILNLLLTGVFLIYGIHHGSAQPLLISSDTVTLSSCDLYPPSIDTIRVFNNTDEEILLRWNRVEFALNDGSGYWLIVDPAQYIPFAYQGQVPLAARDTSMVIFYFYHTSFSPGDQAHLTIRVYDDADEAGTEQFLTAVQYCPLSTSTTDSGSNLPIRIYPNPVYDEATIFLPESTPATSLQLYSITGNVVRQIPVTHPEITFSREGLPGGMYFLGLVHNGHVTGMTKIVVGE